MRGAVAGGVRRIEPTPPTELGVDGDRDPLAVPAPDVRSRVEIAAVAGSLRAASWARSVLRAAARQLPANVGLTIWDGLGAVPPFNEDLEVGPPPAAVADLRHLIQSCDVVLIATPEYNGTLPGVLKNALDWASRPYGQSVLATKPVAAIGTSPLPTGGASALSDLRRVLTGIGAAVIEAELAVPQVHTRIDPEGLISDPELAARITELLDNIVEHAPARRPAPAGASQ